MKKGFKYYFNDSKAKSKALFKKKGSYIKYYMFNIMKLLSLILFPLLPVMNVAEQRMLRNINKGEGIDLSKIYRGTDNPKNYFTYIASGLIKLLIILAGIITISLIGGLAFVIFMNVDILIGAEGVLAIISTAPAAILLLAFIFLMSISLVPVGYLVDTSDGINTSKVVHESFNALWKNGKWQKLLSYVMEALILLGFTLGFILPVMLPILIDPTSLAANIISTLFFIALIIPYLMATAKFDMVFRLYRFNLYEDNVRDIFDVSKRISGVEIDEVKLKGTTTIEHKLANLFDSTNEKEVKVLINTNEVEAKKEAVAKEKPKYIADDKPVGEPKPLEKEESPVIDDSPNLASLDLDEVDLIDKEPLASASEAKIIEASKADIEDEPVADESNNTIEDDIDSNDDIFKEPIEAKKVKVVQKIKRKGEKIEEEKPSVPQVKKPKLKEDSKILEEDLDEENLADSSKEEKPSIPQVKKPKLKEDSKILEDEINEEIIEEASEDELDDDLDIEPIAQNDEEEEVI